MLSCVVPVLTGDLYVVKTPVSPVNSNTTEEGTV